MANFIDYEYNDPKKPSSIIVWEQDYETNKIVEKKFPIKDYLYFYAETINEENALKDLISQRGTKIQKLFAKDYEDFKKGISAKEVQSYGFNTYETDIEPKDKCMLDNYGKDNQKAPKWNLALYDIETDILADQTFMDMRNNANREITAISVWYSLPNKFFQLTLVPPYLRDYWDFDKVEKRGEFNIFYFDNEKKLLETFFELNKLYEVSAIGAWNADFFDTNYIYKRALKYWSEEETALKMGRFNRVRVNKVERGDEVENVYHPIGMIWYDCLEAYKKNGPELESFKLNDVAEIELETHKVDFEGNFEELYHGTREDRKKFDKLVKGLTKEERIEIVKMAEKKFKPLFKDLLPKQIDKVQTDEDLIEEEKITRAKILVTKELEKMISDEKFMSELSEEEQYLFKIFTLIEKFKATYDLFIDYSNQDTKLLYDLEMKIKKFDTLMMLAQYNVCLFYDVFGTMTQVEQGITNFAHNFKNMVVIDRDYDIEKQPYNKYVDKDLIRIRKERDFEIKPDDSEKIKELKKLAAMEKIPGAHVLLPQIGLISYDENETPKLAREYKKLKQELEEIEAELSRIDELLSNME